MEKDDEATNSAYDFGARMYNSQVGRWLATDPKEAKYPSLSTYSFAANNPIFFIDNDGKEIEIHGSPAFKAFIVNQLRIIASTDLGRQVVEAIIESDKIITIKEANLDKEKGIDGYFKAASSLHFGDKSVVGYVDPGKDGNIPVPFQNIIPIPTFTKNENLWIKSRYKYENVPTFIALAHELYHAFQYIDDKYSGHSTRTREGKDEIEREAMAFENAIRDVFGFSTSYRYGYSSENSSDYINIMLDRMDRDVIPENLMLQDNGMRDFYMEDFHRVLNEPTPFSKESFDLFESNILYVDPARGKSGSIEGKRPSDYKGGKPLILNRNNKNEAMPRA